MKYDTKVEKIFNRTFKCSRWTDFLYVLHQCASLFPLLFRIFVNNVHTYILHMYWSEFQDCLDFLLLNHTSHIQMSQSEDSPNVLSWTLHLALWNHMLHTYIWFLCMNVCFYFMCIFKPCSEFGVKVQFEHFNDFQLFLFLVFFNRIYFLNFFQQACQ